MTLAQRSYQIAIPGDRGGDTPLAHLAPGRTPTAPGRHSVSDADSVNGRIERFYRDPHLARDLVFLDMPWTASKPDGGVAWRIS